MIDGYIREFNIELKTEREKELELIQNIINTKREIKTAEMNFEFAQEELVDYYIYEAKANQAKLNYLIKKAKKKGICVDMISEIKYKLENEAEVS